MSEFHWLAVLVWAATKIYFIYVGSRIWQEKQLRTVWAIIAIDAVVVPLAQYLFFYAPNSFTSFALSWVIVYTSLAVAMVSYYDSTEERAAWNGFLAYGASAAFCMVYLVLDALGLYFKGLMWILSSSLCILFVYLLITLHMRSKQIAHVGAYRK